MAAFVGLRPRYTSWVIDTRACPTWSAIRRADDDADAVRLVLTAEQIAPDQVHRHFLTHSLVHSWLRASRVKPTPELNRLARATGIIDH